MNVIRIEAGSEAWHRLVSMTAGGRDISLDVRADGIALKLGEGMWTPTLRITLTDDTGDFGELFGDGCS